MIQREIKKAVSGQSFFYNDEETGKSIHVDALTIEEFNHYYQLWDDFHWLRILPNGKGTLAERRWVLEVIKSLEKVHKETLNYMEAKSIRQASKGNKNFNMEN